jgi:hypothetical protein
MKRCTKCAREIPESATACVHCASPGAHLVAPAASTHVSPQEALNPLDAGSQPAVAMPVQQPAVTSKPAGRRMDPRMMLGVGFLVVAGALALVVASSSPAVPVVGTTPAPAATTPTPTPALAPVAPGVVVSKWKQADRDWLWNVRKGAAFELRSENRVPIWQGIAQPLLVIRCEPGLVQTLVYTASALQIEPEDNNHTVRITFDNEPQIEERWADSTDHDALFAPDGAAFARRLMQARTLKFGYTPHNAARAVAEFHVTGLEAIVAPAAKQCHWK